jgi:glutamyl-tRNA reductase
MLESLTFKDEKRILKEVCRIESVQECVLIQTCHRVEIYCVTNGIAKNVVKHMVKLWSKNVGVSSDVLEDVLRVYYGKDVLLHLFYIAAGLESMVIGEDQILGQVRTAYVNAKSVGTVGLVLEKVFMKAVNVGRRVRTETGINEGSVSISSASVDLAVKEFGSLNKVKALVIGAGEAGSIVAENLHKKGIGKLLIANRTYTKGVELASKVSGKAIKFGEMFKVLSDVDLVVAAVSTEKPVLTVGEVKEALKRRRSGRLFIIDISQPRFVEEKVGSLERVVLRNIDDLKGVVEENIGKRVSESEKAKGIICDELRIFESQLGKIMAEPLISRICGEIEEIRRRELKRAFGKMKETDERKKMVVERFSREFAERILQFPIEQLREAALNNDNELLSTAEKLFGVKIERKGE